MYSQNEFVDIARKWEKSSVMWPVWFWRRRIIKLFWNGYPGHAAEKSLQFEKALDEYQRNNSGNGRADSIQMSAISLLERIHYVLWQYYSKKVCSRPENPLFCHYHGAKYKCREAFELWYKSCATRS